MPPPDPDALLVLFDGECNLCHGAVQFLLRRDRRAAFRFASLQSAAGRAALQRAGAVDAVPDSVALVHGARVRFKSAAALAIARRLGLPWSLAAVFWLVPYPLRDWVYDWIARNRHRWFGRREACWVPTAELRARFVDADERR